MDLSERIRLLLLEELTGAQARRPNYSMRAFAAKVGVAQSAISEILSGKRPVTKKSAIRILEGLAKDPHAISSILDQDSIGKAQMPYRSLGMDTFHLISDWHYYAILSLTQTKDFQSNPSWIAQRLGISDSNVKEAVEVLLRLGLIKRDKQGKWKTTGERLAAVSSYAQPALRKANHQNLELAEKALNEVPVEMRDFTAITLCFDPSRIEEARQMIQTFRRKFDQVMELGHKKEVYKLCVQLFPLSRGKTL